MSGKFRKILEEERRNMPSYQFDFCYKKFIPGFISIVVGGVVALIAYLMLKDAVDERFAIIPFLLWILQVLICSVLFLSSYFKMSARLVEDKAIELEDQFVLCEIDIAEEQLIFDGLTTDGIVVSDSCVVPWTRCSISFECMYTLGKVELYFAFFIKNVVLRHCR